MIGFAICFTPFLFYSWLPEKLAVQFDLNGKPSFQMRKPSALFVVFLAVLLSYFIPLFACRQFFWIRLLSILFVGIVLLSVILLGNRGHRKAMFCTIILSIFVFVALIITFFLLWTLKT
jgi:hypothetical protein